MRNLTRGLGLLSGLLMVSVVWAAETAQTPPATGINPSSPAQVEKNTKTLENLDKTVKAVDTKGAENQIKDDDKKEAECRARQGHLFLLRKQYNWFKNEIDKNCKKNAFLEYVKDYAKITKNFNAALGALNKAKQAAEEAFVKANGKPACNDQMSYDQCNDALAKTDTTNAALKDKVAKLKTAIKNLQALKDSRLAAEKKDYYRDMGRCRALDASGEAKAKEVAEFIKAEKGALAKCEKDLKEIKHSNLAIFKEELTAVIAESAKCKKLWTDLLGMIKANIERDKAIRGKRCRTDQAIRTWACGQERVLRGYAGAGSENCTTLGQRIAYAAAVKAYEAGLGIVKAAQASCQKDLQDMRDADAKLDAAQKEQGQDLRECNIDLARHRAKLRLVVAELRD